MSNYFSDKTKAVEELKHFPFETFHNFKVGIKNKDVIDIAIPMDRAREWVTKSQDVSKSQSTIITISMLALYLIPVFYLIAPFVSRDYWLLLMIPVSIIVLFTGSPIARRVFPFHLILLVILGLVWLIGGKFPSFNYWLPILVQYKLLDFIYKGSATYSRSLIMTKESALVWFWKWGDISIIHSDGKEYSQRCTKDSSGYHFYDDIDADWKELIDSKKQG